MHKIVHALVFYIFITPTAMVDGTSSHNMLTNQIICGYQGWFSYPGDGAPINKWKHWFRDTAASFTSPEIDDITVDMYPTTDEYDVEDLRESGIRLNDGRNATFFSNVRPKVVLKHFEWMTTYGISGVFHMRFMESMHSKNNRETKTIVLRNVRDAAELTGRIFAVSYNIAGNDFVGNVLEDLKVDWMRLVDEEGITKSSSYIHQNGLPVLRIYGIGFKTKNVVHDTDELTKLFSWFQYEADERYRVFLVGGVPAMWRNLTGDSMGGEAWKGIYDSLDGIHPWHVGRWRNVTGFEHWYANIIKEDASYCETKGILYMPTMWPGFSWHNTMNQSQPINDIPRQGGDFMWKQAHHYASDPNIKTIWMAQFDEVDEGTAIFKMTSKTSDLPAEGSWLALDADGIPLPSDWYLRLAGEAQKMLGGMSPLTSDIPISPLDPPPCCWVVADDAEGNSDEDSDDDVGDADDGMSQLMTFALSLLAIGIVLNSIAIAFFVRIHRMAARVALTGEGARKRDTGEIRLLPSKDTTKGGYSLNETEKCTSFDSFDDFKDVARDGNDEMCGGRNVEDGIDVTHNAIGDEQADVAIVIGAAPKDVL